MTASPAPAYVPKRVVFVSWQYPEAGGCGRSTELLATGLRRQGIAVEVVSMIPGLRESELDTRAVFKHADLHDGPVFREASGMAARIRGLGRLAMKRVDRFIGLSTASRYLRSLGEDSVVVFTNVGPKKILDPFLRPSLSGPVLIGQHHSSYDGAARTGQLADLPRHFADVDVFVALTSEDAARFGDVLDVPCSAIPNISEAPRRHSSVTRAAVAVALTRYASEKQLDTMIRAFDEATADPSLWGWELHLYGAGDLRADLQSLVDQLVAVHRIFLHDRTDDVASVLDVASINLLTSQYEGFPMSVLEASAHAVPTVAFDCSAGVRELVSDSTGRLVPAGDISAFAMALQEMMLDADARETKGQAALKSVQRYSEAGVVAQWMRLFDDCARPRVDSARP